MKVGRRLTRRVGWSDLEMSSTPLITMGLTHLLTIDSGFFHNYGRRQLETPRKAPIANRR